MELIPKGSGPRIDQIGLLFTRDCSGTTVQNLDQIGPLFTWEHSGTCPELIEIQNRPCCLTGPILDRKQKSI